MLERFNFFDFYGHLVPGVSLWLGLALPILYLRPISLNEGSLSAVAAIAVLLLVVAYQTGLAIQLVIRRVVPSKTWPSSRGGKAGHVHPSDAYLDSGETKFSPSFLARLTSQLRNTFAVDVDVPGGASQRARADAFMQARALLIQGGIARYAEQFEGMYALMRGLMLTSVLAAAFVFGGTLATVSHVLLGAGRFDVMDLRLTIGLAIATIAGVGWLGFRIRGGGLIGRFFALVLLANVLGVLVFSGTAVHGLRPLVPIWGLAVLGVFDVGLALLYERGYRHYADAFARTVYENFSVAVALEKRATELRLFE